MGRSAFFGLGDGGEARLGFQASDFSPEKDLKNTPSLNSIS